ncbi:hypothetical protein SB2_09770 [Methylobacterium radiotolerans]|jgi:hypothetical protein|nr:hypothetical protein SB3_20190 [Methylobacterium radiotolerans]KTS48714.1 hypothetical protein SB2_09770 [Methylobacterium radiotolerans]OXE43397.1 hypothetical protein CCS92_03460 [Methylobacterium radiotolerans]
MEDLRWSGRIEASDGDLMEQFGEVAFVSRIQACPPQTADRAAQVRFQGEGPRASPAPTSSSFPASVTLGPHPSDGTQCHLLVRIVLCGGDLVGEQG